MFKVMEGKETLPFELCFDDKEHKLMMQCCKFQQNRRPKLSHVKTKLQEMQENAGTCAYYFYKINAV